MNGWTNEWMNEWGQNRQIKENFSSFTPISPHSTRITTSWPSENMFQCRGVAYWHWISLPSIGVIVHQAEWKGGKAAVPSQQMDTKYVHDLSAQWLTVRNNTPPHGWDIFMKMHLLKKKKSRRWKKRERTIIVFEAELNRWVNKTA